MQLGPINVKKEKMKSALNLAVAKIKDMVCAGMTVFANYLDTNVLNQLKRCNILRRIIV